MTTPLLASYAFIGARGSGPLQSCETMEAFVLTLLMDRPRYIVLNGVRAIAAPHLGFSGDDGTFKAFNETYLCGKQIQPGFIRLV